MNNKILLLVTLLLSQISNGSMTDNKSSFSQLLCSSITALPERYHTPEYFKVYSLFAASFSKRSSVGMVQFYKHCVYNQDPLKRWPKELVWQLFNDYLNTSFFIISLEKIAKSVNANAIRTKFINTLLYPLDFHFLTSFHLIL